MGNPSKKTKEACVGAHDAAAAVRGGRKRPHRRSHLGSPPHAPCSLWSGGSGTPACWSGSRSGRASAGRQRAGGRFNGGESAGGSGSAGAGPPRARQWPLRGLAGLAGLHTGSWTGQPTSGFLGRAPQPPGGPGHCWRVTPEAAGDLERSRPRVQACGCRPASSAARQPTAGNRPSAAPLPPPPFLQQEQVPPPWRGRTQHRRQAAARPA